MPRLFDYLNTKPKLSDFKVTTISNTHKNNKHLLTTY